MRSFLLIVAFVALPLTVRAQTEPAIQAFPVSSSIDVDGLLDEPDWFNATPASGFRQLQPVEGEPARNETEVRVLYGSDHVFIGARMFDDEPALIERKLGRRDELNRADWFLVAIDAYFDQRTAYLFGVNAAGVQLDAMRSGPEDWNMGEGPGDGYDTSWDAIWTSAVRVTEEGWNVEMRIPYSMLRFSRSDNATWGIHFTRRTPRLGEVDEWPLVPVNDRSNLVARFGRLRELRGIEPRRNVQIRPYTMTAVHHQETFPGSGTGQSEYVADIGGDLKVGLGPGITLDATINPDFGQIEADPAVLNLTAFETFYEERRPFFIEGSQIYNFSVGTGNLLYTRRIGADAPILGAAKLSGRTSKGFSFGVLAASTGHDFADDSRYGVGRVSQQFGTSSAGAALTYYDNLHRSMSGGVDWDIRTAGDRYGFEGFIAFTSRGSELFSDAITGTAGKFWVVKRQGTLSGFLGVDVFGHRFNPNDVGQLDAANFIMLLNNLEYNVNGGQPFGPFLRANVGAFSSQSFSYRERLNQGFSTSINGRATLRGFQEIGFDMEIVNPFGGYDLYETRGLGPWARPLEVTFEAELETDSRKSWQIEPEIGGGFQEGGGHGISAGLRGDWNVGSRLTLSGIFDYEWINDLLAWSSNDLFARQADGWVIETGGDPLPVKLTDPNALDRYLQSSGSPGIRRPVFGKRDTRQMDFTLRSDVTLTPNLSFQLYSQLFVARGRYDEFQLLIDRDTLIPFDGYPKRNEFTINALQVNAVLRWEYLPGSILFVVWTHGRHGDDRLNPIGPWTRSLYDRPLSRHIGDTFDIYPANVFQVKLSYTFLY